MLNIWVPAILIMGCNLFVACMFFAVAWTVNDVTRNNMLLIISALFMIAAGVWALRI